MPESSLKQTPKLDTLIRQGIDQRLILANGGFLARITAWSSSTGRATVDAHFQLQPAGSEDEPDPDPETVTIEDVPILFLAVNGWTIRAASAVGDLVWCSGSSRSLEEIEAWKSGGAAYVPASPRVMSLDDVVAFPVSWGSGSTANLVIEGHGASIELTAGGKIRLNGGGPASARDGDSVEMGTLVFSAPATIAGTYTPPGGVPLPFVVGVMIPLSGRINSGSASVEVG